MKKAVLFLLITLLLFTGCGSKSLLDSHPIESESVFTGDKGTKKDEIKNPKPSIDDEEQRTETEEDIHDTQGAYFDDTGALEVEPEVYTSEDVSFLGIAQKEGYPILDLGEKLYNDDGSYYIYEGTLGTTVLITSAESPQYYDRAYHTNEIIPFPLCDESAISVYDCIQNTYLPESDIIYLALEPECYDARTWENMYSDELSALMGSMIADNCRWTDSEYVVTFTINPDTGKVTSLNAKSETEEYQILLLQ